MSESRVPQVPLEDLRSGVHRYPEEEALPESVQPADGRVGDPVDSVETAPPASRAADLERWQGVNEYMATPKAKGWRGIARSVGLPVAAESPAERRSQLVSEVSQSWPTVKTVTVLNTKGDSGKTSVSIVLAWVLSVFRGGSVALLDNNPTGNMARRLSRPQTTPYTIQDLIDNLPRLEDPSARRNDVVTFMRYESGGPHALVARERPIRPSPDAKHLEIGEPTISKSDFNRVWEQLAKHFSPIIVDCGNNDADPPTLAALEKTDQLVIPVKWDRPTCVAAQKVLATLEQTGRAKLANDAILVATWGPGEAPNKGRQREYMEQFEKWGHEIYHLPTDGHIAAKTEIHWEGLHPKTQTAALEIAAAIARRFNKGQ